MCYNFSANQFDREFKAQRLGNWEVPKWFPDRPRPPRKQPTRIIVNDRGHLLPGIAKAPGDSPWGNYVGTWDLPRKITRKTAAELTAPPASKIEAWERRSSHVPLAVPLPKPPPPSAKEPEKLPERSPPDKIERVPAPTDLQHEDAMRNSKNGSGASSRKSTPPGSAISSLRINGHAAGSVPQITSTPPERTSANAKNTSNGYQINKVDSQIQTNGIVNGNVIGNTRERKPGSAPPLSSAYSNFQIAKKLHRENLEHKPLPDKFNESLLRTLASQQLDVSPGAVAYRARGASGPNQITKNRVHRPRTAGVIPQLDDAGGPRTLEKRPSTSGGKQSPTQNSLRSPSPKPPSLTNMHLAICWDLKPPSERDEPRPPTHIDGSNGSAAPAVFTLVHPPPSTPPKAEEDTTVGPCGTKEGCGTPPPTQENANCGSSGGCGSDLQPKTAWETSDDNNNRHNETEQDIFRRRSGSVDNLQQGNQSGSMKSHSKLHQSSPNLATSSQMATKKRLLGSRPCLACDRKQLLNQPDQPRSSDYKMAFKAGKPTNSASSSERPSGLRPPTATLRQKAVKIPRPRNPFARRSYSIDTLAPPFSLWPGHTGQGYPEHWRLASVYQHAYKPVEARRRPLLASVYQ